MASVTLTFAANTEAGALLRQVAAALNELASSVPDRVSSGASTVLTIDNAVGGTCGLQITAGPYAGAQVLV